ncbi:MAG: beta strand repeat-containing protein, partial [Ferruginibacter sp.]
MKTKRLLNSISKVKAISFITLMVLMGSAMINSLSAQAFTHIWKGGTGNWGSTNWYAVHTNANGTASSGSTSLTLGAANANIAVGDYVAGYGIAPGTTVQTYPGTGTSVTLSQATTAALSSLQISFYKSGSSNSTTPVATSLVLINTGTCTIQSGTAAVGRVFMGNTSATTQGELVIASGGSLTTSAAGNNNTTNANLLFMGGKITNNGTLNATATGYTTNGYCIRFENPSVVPTVSWGLFGSGTLNINNSATTGTSGGPVVFNNTNTPLNAPEIDLNNATYTNATTAYSFNFTVPTAAAATVGATYTYNGNTYTVVSTKTGGTGTTLSVTSSVGTTYSSGSLAFASGTGDATIAFTAMGFTTSFIGFTVNSGANGIIGGTGLSINTGAVSSGLIAVNNFSANSASLTINSEVTLNLTQSSSATVGVIISSSTAGSTTTLTNKGTINITGTSSKAAIAFGNSTASSNAILKLDNQGTISTDMAISGTYTGVLHLSNGGTSNALQYNITNSGTMTLKTTSVATNTGYALYVGSVNATAVSITNTGTFEFYGTFPSTGVGTTTFNNNAGGTVN